MDWLGQLGQAAAGWDIFRRATGDAFLPTVALGLLLLLIVWGWRAPQLPWFTGRVALAMIAMLVMLLVLAVVLAAWNRQDIRPVGRSGGTEPRVQPGPRLPAPIIDRGG